jgi:hypothetical protein
MTFVIKNLTTAPMTLDGVTIDPGEKLEEAILSAAMIAARNTGTLGVAEVWFLPIVSRLTGVTTVIRVLAAEICHAIIDYHRGVDNGWAGYISILLGARTTREPDGSPDVLEIEKAVALALLKPCATL